MRLFKKRNFLKKIFLVELILIFSFMSSYVISSIIIKSKNQTPSVTNQYKYLFEDYTIFRSILELPYELFNQNGQNRTVNTLSKIDPSTLLNIFIADILKIEEARQHLREKKYNLAYQLVTSLSQTHKFLWEKKHKIYLQTLYFKQKYGEYIRQFNILPGKNDLEMKLFLVNSLLKIGEKDKAFQLFKKLFFTNKLKPFQDTISAKIMRDFLKKLNHEDWLKKFNDLARTNSYSEFLRVRKFSNAPQLQNLFLAEFSYKQKRYSTTISLLNKVGDKKLLIHKNKLLLKVDIRRKNYRDIFKKLLALKGDTKIYSEVLFDAANILLIHHQLGLSQDLFNKYINHLEEEQKDYLDNSKYWKSIWLSAWIYYQKREHDKAASLFKKGSMSPMDSYRVANIYWLHQLNKTTPEELENFPFSYYYTKTQYASTNNHFKGISRFINLINERKSPTFYTYIIDLKSLLNHGLIQESLDFIDWIKRKNKLNDAGTNTFKIIESLIYLKKQDFYFAFLKFRTNFNSYQSIRLPAFLSDIYLPVKYETIISNHCKRLDLDKYLVLALIRQESFFRPDVVSPSRANGLMQLLYGTANKMAKKENKRIKRWDLYNPEVNIKLGTEYLKILLNRHKGKLHLALASYNAGEHRVDKWLEEFGDLPEDEFIEMIPFTETRNYVKKVLRNYYYYRYYNNHL